MKVASIFLHRLVISLALIVALGLTLSPALAQTTESATTTIGGNWTATGPTPTWTCNPALSPCVPNNSSSDVFDVGINGGNVTLDSSSSLTSVSINSLSITAPPFSSASLEIKDGETLSVANNLTSSVANYPSPSSSDLYLDNSGSGGSTLNVGGNLTTSGYMQIGIAARGGQTSAASTVNVTGAFITDNLYMSGGGTPGATALVNVGGAAPSTLTGTYLLQGNTGGAAIEFGSGGITQIGVSLTLDGANALMELSGQTGTNSALTGLTTILSTNTGSSGPLGLSLYNGAVVSTSGNLTNSAYLNVDSLQSGEDQNISFGGSTLNVGGSLTNNGDIQIGNGGMNAPSTVNVTGTFDNTGGILMYGGYTSGNQSTMTVGGAAPSTLTGTYTLTGNAGGAALNFGSGGIVQIGDGSPNSGNSGSLTIDGSNAFIEVAGASGNSALTDLTTIASNGSLDLLNGAVVSTSRDLTNNGFLYVDQGGSTLNVGGNLTNNGGIRIGNAGMNASSTVNVAGSFNNVGSRIVSLFGGGFPSGGQLQIFGGNAAGAETLLNISGAAPSILTGVNDLIGSTGGAVIEYGGGAITQIGDGGTHSGSLAIVGSNAFVEVGPTNSNSALTGLTTIANNGALVLQDGAAVITSTALRNSGSIYMDLGGIAGTSSTLTIGGDLTNSGFISVSGNYNAFDALSAIAVTNNGTVFVAFGKLTADQLYTQTAGATTVNGSLQAGEVDIEAGSLKAQAGNIGVGGAPSAVRGSLTVVSPGVVRDNGNITIGYTFDGGVGTNAGSVDIGSAGTLSLLGRGVYTQTAGTTDVDGTLISPTVTLNGGTLTGTGTVQGSVSNTGGMVEGGDDPAAGTLTVTGNYTQGAGGMLMADINGGTAGNPTTGWDVLDIGGSASLGGMLDISLNNSFLPTNGEMFQILDATGGLGGTTFASLTGSTSFGSGGSWDVLYGADTVTLEAAYTKSATPEPASLLLFGTGLLALGWIARRRLVAQRS